MGQSLPSISGDELLKLLVRNGWKEGRKTTHGIQISKLNGERTLVAIIPLKHKAMPHGTLMAILGPKQTNIGREGFLEMFYSKV